MNVFDLVGIVLTLAALFGYLNFRFIKLPPSIGLMLIALLFSLSLIVARHLGWAIEPRAEAFVRSIDFNVTLMQGMLSFLLFAGALNVNLEDLVQHKWSVTLFTLFGVLCSTAVVGCLTCLFFNWLGLTLPLLHCLLFGALISPTDPVAVLSLLKRFGAPRTLEVNIAGEALFNDGVGVVVFLALLELITGHQALTASHVAFLFLTEAVGGIALGLLLGWITYLLLKSIDNYQVEVLLTLALVTGGYALADALHASGPLAIVAAGILIGNHGRHFAMSDKTREQIDTFWELIDEILNAVLFVLLGLEVLILTFKQAYWLAAAVTIPVVLLARWISVLLPASLMRARFRSYPGLVSIMTWGGLRGGISVALALSLPAGPGRDLVLAVTYAVVVFQEWVESRLHELRHGEEAKFLATIQRLKPRRGEVGKAIREQKNYFANQAERMNYKATAQRGWPIGSGAVESACGGKQGRFKRRGQFWTRAGVGHLEALIEARENNHWDELWFAE